MSLALLAGCAHYHQNQPLHGASCPAGYDYTELAEAPPGGEETFVVLTFSGGGTRAAALAYGVLAGLRETKISGGKTILDEVDVISTVSGGSFTGAYYTLFGDRIFSEFREKFLYSDIQGELLRRVANPVNLWRLASPFFSRIDLAAELYDESIFNGRTYGTLTPGNTRPFLIINATNLYNGARFEFTGKQFCYLGSDIRSFPVARAVAASSAFPILLSPLSLVNYPYPAEKKITAQDKLALKDYTNNKRRYYAALNNTVYANDREHPYVHLMDGGLADNLGLRAIYDLYVREDIRAAINQGRIKKMLVIVVNAKTAKKETFDRDESPPGLETAAFKTATVSMDNYTFESAEVFAQLFKERIAAQQSRDGCQQLLDRHSMDGYQIPPLAGGNLKLYLVELAFDNFTDAAERDYFNNLPTSFKLSREEVDRLIAAGGQLLKRHPEFKKFIKENKN